MKKSGLRITGKSGEMDICICIDDPIIWNSSISTMVMERKRKIIVNK